MADRWGIVGYGWVARDYMAPAIRSIGGRVVAVADPGITGDTPGLDPEVARFRDVDTLLNAGGCDMIYVASPNNSHADIVCKIAGRGIPTLCEKPIASTLADAERMAAAVMQSGMVYGTAFDQRHHPAHRAAHRKIQDGTIGRPVAVRIVYACWLGADWTPTGGTAPTDHQNWRTDPVVAGGGAVIDLAPHGLDLVQFLLGQPIDRLDLMIQRRIHAYGVDDGGILTARTAHDVLATLHVAYNCRDALPRRRLEVVGDEGMITALDTMGQSAGGCLTHTCGSTGIVSAIPFDQTESPFVAQAAAFAAAAAGRSHDFSMTRDIASARLLDAAYRRALACR